MVIPSSNWPKETLKSRKKNFDSQKRRAKLGSATGLEISNAQVNLANAYELNIQAIFAYEMAKVLYFRAAGDLSPYLRWNQKGNKYGCKYESHQTSSMGHPPVSVAVSFPISGPVSSQFSGPSLPHPSSSKPRSPQKPHRRPKENACRLFRVCGPRDYRHVVSLVYISDTHISTNNSYIEAEVWPINFRSLGYVKSILVEENDHVKNGQLLAQLDDSDVQIELRYKQAKFEKTLADVKRARALNKSRLVSTADLETAEATLTAMQADLDGALLKGNLPKSLH